MAALREKELASAGGHSGGSTILKNSSGRETQQIPAHFQRLSKEDREIAMRLEKLKEDKKGKHKHLYSVTHPMP